MTLVTVGSPRVDVSAIITFHAEGLLAHPTLLSIERCRIHAEAAGLQVEFVITLDDADPQTRRAVREHPVIRDTDAIHEVSYRDLSSSRNHAIAEARGRYVGTFDGDDYFSANWITQCVASIRAAGKAHIFHPQMIVAFGEWNAYWWQVDQASDYYRPHTLLSLNYWNACAFAEREVFLHCPYEVARPGECGFGYEDWHWNCQTIAAGCVHNLAERTVRFERRKASGSLGTAHERSYATLRPSPFFDQL